ncbi:MAG: sigma-70 family RNA polymerase sigma factor [Gemmatimonadetes bacterium]|jgi:RNA polymerase sigma factor (sigma-70 family)|nr:sigma-70 family RNA polymerase sigma factor [Gemmatimonadota bacterium]
MGFFSSQGTLTGETLQPLALPQTLTRLRFATDATTRDDAWAPFVASYSDVILRACRHVLRDHDVAMDGYTFVLDALRENGCQRLAGYEPRQGSSFETWLVVIARRLALDYYRHKYGRSRSNDDGRQAEQVVRRRLEDLLSEKIDVDDIERDDSGEADAPLRRAQLREGLRQSIAQLDPEDQLLLAMRFRDERPVNQIAKVLHAPTVFHVYRRLGTILRQLRRMLDDRGVEGPEP